MTAQDIVFVMLMAVSLSACCGLRAFLPVTVVSVLAWTGHLTLAPTFHWVGEPITVAVFALAAILEMIGDKYPGVDHALDAAGLIIKPVAGALLASSLITGVDPTLGLVLGIITGATLAGGVALAKAKTRVLTTAATGGLGNTVLSFAEDGITIGGVALGVIVPLFAGSLVILGAVLMVRKLTARKRAKEQAVLTQVEV